MTEYEVVLSAGAETWTETIEAETPEEATMEAVNSYKGNVTARLADKEAHIDRLVSKNSAQELHNYLMAKVGGETGTTPGYSKRTMAKIIYELQQ